MMISKRLRILSASLFFFLLFILLSGLVHYDFFRGIDYQSMLFIQKIQSLSIDYFFSVLTLLGSSEAVFRSLIIDGHHLGMSWVTCGTPANAATARLTHMPF